MYIIVFGVFIIKLHISVSEPQFPVHIDLHKVGEAIFNHEKYNILKLSTHRITDHFKDFMLRTESSNQPEKRIFIDNNGFRHDWSGFGEKTKSLRKTDLKHISGSVENASANTPQFEVILTDGNNNTNATVEDTNISDNNSNENENNGQEVENNASNTNNTVLTDEDAETPESKETTTTVNLFPETQKNNSNTENTIEKRLREGDTIDTVIAESKPKPADKENKRTVATTTFFCPYLGTITMSEFID